MPKSPILGGFSRARSRSASDNRAVNLALELTETKDGKVPGFLFLTSGLDLLTTVGAGPIRGEKVLNDTLYLVSNNEVYSLDAAGHTTLLGTISIQKTPVSMFHNTRQLMIVDGVGAWIVPGGLPLTSGTIDASGGLYKIGDTVTLLASSGTQTSYPIIQITSIVDNPVTDFGLVNAGTTYNTASGVATTNIAQPHAGIGSGFTINIASVGGGGILSSTLNAGGSNYAVGDNGLVNVASKDAVYQVTSVSGGAVTGYILLNPGTGYSVASGVATMAAPGIPANTGFGLTLNITASAGPITTSTIANGGQGYVIGAAGFVTGGTGDATYLVRAVGANGSVTGFTIIQGGTIDSAALSFTQKSTSGSGSGLTLTLPTFGANIGLVPVTMPFPNPVVGDVSDGFGLLVFQNSQNIAQSDQADLSTWDPLNFGVADQSPDNCLSIHVVHDEAYVLKENNTEVWVDQGNPGFAFSPVTTVHIETGIIAPFSVAVADEDLIWLSRNDQGQGIVVKATGYKPVPISTQALVAEFQRYSNLGDAIAYVRQEGGHVYYVITFPEAGATWMYDKTTSALLGYPQWSRLAAFNNDVLERHWGNAFTVFKWWPGPVESVPVDYNPLSVTMTDTILRSAQGLNGLPTSFSSAVFSVWLDIPDGVSTGIIFGNQGSGATPGLQITVQNDLTGTPQITIEAWDASANPIVLATYNFTVWANWMNLLISLDTSANKIQVWANAIVSGALVESELTAASLTWSSTNPIAPAATQSWMLETVP